MAGAAGDLDVLETGSGPRVVLVHGSVLGRRTWEHQAPLAGDWRLCIADRPGFGASAPLPRNDFEAEAPMFAALLGDGAHLVGHSYGAVIALHAAALRPEAVRSLTISEPGCFNVAAEHPQVAEQLANGRLLYEHAGQLEPLDFLRAFRGGVGSTHATPPELQGELLHGAELLMRERPPWEADPPLAALRACAFPKLVISGAHSPVFEAVCDAVAQGIGAERATLAGRKHSIPATGAPYNELVHAFMLAVERGARAARPTTHYQ